MKVPFCCRARYVGSAAFYVAAPNQSDRGKAVTRAVRFGRDFVKRLCQRLAASGLANSSSFPSTANPLGENSAKSNSISEVPPGGPIRYPKSFVAVGIRAGEQRFAAECNEGFKEATGGRTKPVFSWK